MFRVRSRTILKASLVPCGDRAPTPAQHAVDRHCDEGCGTRGSELPRVGSERKAAPEYRGEGWRFPQLSVNSDLTSGHVAKIVYTHGEEGESRLAHFGASSLSDS